MLFDCHCHLESPLFDDDLEEVLQRASGNLLGVVCSAVEPKDFEKSLAMHDRMPNFLYVSLGLHPEYAGSISAEDIERAITFIKEKSENIVSIGEVGLDYYWCQDERTRQKQKEMFRRFVDLSMMLDKPLIVHIRQGKDKQGNAYEDAFEILQQGSAKKVLLHMFGYKKFLTKALENGWHISTNAIVESSKDYKKIVKAIPLDHLMLETDSPCLVPQMLKSRGVKRNEPLFIEQTAKKVALIKETSFEEVCSQTTFNARKFFEID